MSTHEITRRTTADGEQIYELDYDGSLRAFEFRMTATEPDGVFRCSCGESFESEENAAAHLAEVEA